jgi:TetR/AcrR family transcriptional regulator, regulator of mycofactocin system
MMVSELEGVALRMFEERGFAEVKVEEIAAQAQISVRTFYRYFPTKDDVLQVLIGRRSRALRDALSARPSDEPLLHSFRLAVEEAYSAEDPDLLRCWINVIRSTPSVLRNVIGGIHLNGGRVIAEFMGSRLGQPSSAFVPAMLAAAAMGVIQAAQTRWFFEGGDLATAVSAGLAVLEQVLARDLQG